MSKWYVKQVSPESVIAVYDNLTDAEKHTLKLNTDYQTDNYIVEAYDPIQAANFPTIEEILTISAKMKGNK